jgi:hypothetical protein
VLLPEQILTLYNRNNYMNNPTSDAGVIQVILERLEKQRLPQLLAMQKKLDDGVSLDSAELDFLEMAVADARKTIPLIDRHPEAQALAVQVVGLYTDISKKALQIEKGYPK